MSMIELIREWRRNMTQDQFEKKIKELSDIVAKSLNTTFFDEPLSQKTRDRIVEECIKPCIDTSMYDIICDETNNTPEDIMNQKVVFDIKTKA